MFYLKKNKDFILIVTTKYGVVGFSSTITQNLSHFRKHEGAKDFWCMLTWCTVGNKLPPTNLKCAIPVVCINK